jgi:hypothetical protein
VRAIEFRILGELETARRDSGDGADRFVAHGPWRVGRVLRLGTVKLTGLRRPLTISDAGKAVSKEDGDALEDHDRGHG